jgi:chromosome segregation ATPase
LERELGEARMRAQQLTDASAQSGDDLQDARALQTQLEHRVRELQSAVDERDARIAQLDASAIEAAEQAPLPSSDEELQQASRERDQAAALAEQMRAEQEVEISRIEQKLLERAREIDLLRRDIDHRDQLVRELVGLFEAPASPSVQGGAEQLQETVAGLREQLDRLAAVTASREAELQKATWRVQELETELSGCRRPDPAGVEVTELERALFSAQFELDALRRSLQQEHETCERLASGSDAAEALAEAHDKLQQQSVLTASLEAEQSSTSGSVDR